MSDDEDVPQLAADTLAILQEFLAGKETSEEVKEDWQLSQFWYDDITTKTLANSVEKIAGKNGKVVLISCPTLMQPLLDRNVDTTLLEFDNRFFKFGERFVHYDYREPVNINPKFHHSFDLIVADPPFLSDECLEKALQTVSLLKKTAETRVILCTGAVMEQPAAKLAGLKPTAFVPKHKNNLANEFWCYTNFGELPKL